MKNRERTEYAEAISEHANVEALYLVTGETDVVAVVRFQNYPQLKRFLMETVTSIPGVKESKTAMVVTTFKEGGEIRYETAPSESAGIEK